MKTILLMFTCGLAVLAGCTAANHVTPLEIVAQVNEPVGNVTVTPKGTPIVSLHQFYEPEQRVAALRGKRLVAFPNEDLNRSNSSHPARLDTVLGVQCDPQGIVWMLDNAMRGGSTPKLVAWDTNENELHRILYLPPPVSRADSFLNDLAVDRTNETIYIADPAPNGRAALIVLDLRTGLARRVLEGHISVIPEDVEMVIDDKPLTMQGPDGKPIRPKIGVNPIALDKTNKTLYFGPMSGTKLYKVATADLRDASLSELQLQRRVELHCKRPISDGISIDDDGNIFLSSVTENAVGVVNRRGTYSQLHADDELLSWPDAFSFGPDGALYVVANKLHRTPALNNGKYEAKPPFYILRFYPRTAGVVGR